jgi:hypothetical protein
MESIILSGILFFAALACADVEQDNPNDPGADNYEYTGMSVLPKSGGDLQADGDIKIIFSDVMDPASLVLGGSLMNGAVPPYANIDWTSTSIAEDTLTISPPGGYWDVGTGKTLTLECTPVIGLPVTLDLGYSVVSSVSANESPSSGGTLAADGTVTLVFTREMNPASLQITGSADESTLILDDKNNANVTWSSGTNANDTLTLTPKYSIWERGTGMTLHVYCESALSSAVSVTRDLEYDVSYTVQAGASPANGSTITGNEPITIQFGESMNPSYFKNAGGTIDAAPGSVGVAWSKTAYDNDTVTLTPSATIWQQGAGKTFSAEFESTLGATKPTRTVSLAYDVEYSVYVRNIDVNDKDANPGTKISPKKTIQAAIDYAASTYGSGAVKVAEGTYSSSTSTVVTMKNMVSMLGGYKSDFSARNAGSYVSIIQDDRTLSGVDPYDPNRVVECPASITDSANTVIDGFTIKLGGGAYNSGVFCQGGVRINHNVIQGKSATTAGINYAYGIFITAGVSTIAYNTIDPGYGSGSGDCTYGIYDSGTESQIAYNTINGGHGSNTYGIYSTTSVPTSTLTIDHNTIDCGGGSNIAFVIVLDNDSQPRIDNNEFTNNIPVNKLRGVFESGSNADPVSLTHNNFNFITSTANHYYYIDDTSELIAESGWTSIYVSIVGDNQPLSNAAWGNTRKE